MPSKLPTTDPHYIPSAVEFKAMTLEQLREWQDHLEERKLGIALQLDEDEGNRTDEWRRKAEAAELIVTTKLRLVERLLGDISRAERKANKDKQADLEAGFRTDKRMAFIKAAERLLQPDTYAELWRVVEAEVPGAERREP